MAIRSVFIVLAGDTKAERRWPLKMGPDALQMLRNHWLSEGMNEKSSFKKLSTGSTIVQKSRCNRKGIHVKLCQMVDILPHRNKCNKDLGDVSRTSLIDNHMM